MYPIPKKDSDQECQSAQASPSSVGWISQQQNFELSHQFTRQYPNLTSVSQEVTTSIRAAFSPIPAPTRRTTSHDWVACRMVVYHAESWAERRAPKPSQERLLGGGEEDRRERERVGEEADEVRL